LDEGKTMTHKLITAGAVLAATLPAAATAQDVIVLVSRCP
jgi:hypothetical protein